MPEEHMELFSYAGKEYEEKKNSCKSGLDYFILNFQVVKIILKFVLKQNQYDITLENISIA